MIRRYARFVAFLIVGALVTAALARQQGLQRALLIGFDAGALVFLASLVSLFHGATAATMRERSQANEPDHHWLSIIAMGIGAVTVTAIGQQLSAASGGEPGESATVIGLACVSLLFVWLFANAIASIHYAHLWYLRGGTDGADRRGLDFPGPGDTPDLAPDYGDFAYFALVLSMTFQVSDVVVTDKSMRRLVTLHGLVAFLFNIGVIALSVSLATSVLGR